MIDALLKPSIYYINTLIWIVIKIIKIFINNIYNYEFNHETKIWLILKC